MNESGLDVKGKNGGKITRERTTRERERHTHRQTDRQTDRQTQTDRQRQRELVGWHFEPNQTQTILLGLKTSPSYFANKSLNHKILFHYNNSVTRNIYL